MDVEGGREVRPHHYIRSILPTGPVGRAGVLQGGDELLEVGRSNQLGVDRLNISVESISGQLKVPERSVPRRGGEQSA